MVIDSKTFTVFADGPSAFIYEIIKEIGNLGGSVLTMNSYHKVPGFESAKVDTNGQHMSYWARNKNNPSDNKLVFYKRIAIQGSRYAVWAQSYAKEYPSALGKCPSVTCFGISVKIDNKSNVTSIYKLTELNFNYPNTSTTMNQSKAEVRFLGVEQNGVTIKFTDLITSASKPSEDTKPSPSSRSSILSTILIILLVIIIGVIGTLGFVLWKQKRDRNVDDDNDYSRIQNENGLSRIADDDSPTTV
jgi:hypothetical protein